MNSKLSQLILSIFTTFFSLCACYSPRLSFAQTNSLPLLKISNFQYEGAFRLPASTFGSSNLNYSQGPIEFNADRNSLFIVGHTHNQEIAEFQIPPLVSSTSLSALNMADAPLQSFSPLLERVAGGNLQQLDRIGGIEYVKHSGGSELIVNAYEYYDAPADNTDAFLVVRNGNNIVESQIDGFFRYQGEAGHTSGWISPIPAPWQAVLDGTHITGNSSGIPIIGRTSVGPSAFAFNALDIVGKRTAPSPVSTSTLLDFSLTNPLNADLSNDSRSNKVWTHLSRAVYGFIIPGTRTYATFGYSGGHESGVCYKCTQNNGNTCGGYCAPDAGDYYHYYWLWDLNDLGAVKNGQISPHEPRPYEHGEFPTPFKTSELGGGTFDPASGLLYLSVQRADSEQGEFSNPPIIVAYRLNADGIDTTIPARPTRLRIEITED